MCDPSDVDIADNACLLMFKGHLLETSPGLTWLKDTEYHLRS